MTRTAVAMSGGVDSSVAALLLHEAGEPVIGLSMRIRARGRSSPPPHRRDASPDFDEARRAADHLGIPHHVVDLANEFRRTVLDRFLSDYRSGRTPIPCVQCNSGVKFGHLAARAADFGAGRMATGHYARIGFERRGRRVQMRRAQDRSKDQSYFLFGLTQEQLARAVFPLGDLSKESVRELAAARGLPNARRPESQDACFVSSGSYLEFIHRLGGDSGSTGEIVDTQGRLLGHHKGLEGFTIGQRRGLGIPADRPYYVVALDPSRNRVLVGEEREQYRSALVAEEANWLSIPEPRTPFSASAQIRSTHGGAEARIEPLDGGRFRVRFEVPQRAITPGQAVVLYDGDLLLGGGFITAAE